MEQRFLRASIAAVGKKTESSMSDPRISYCPVSHVALKPMVQMIWSLETPSVYMMPGAIAPDAQVEFVLFLNGNGQMRLYGVEHHMTRQPTAFAYTQLHGCLEIGTCGPASFVAFRTNLVVAHALLGFPAIEEVDACIDLSEVWPAHLPQLLSNLKTSDRADIGEIVEKFVMDRLSEYKQPIYKLSQLYDWVFAKGAFVRMAQVGPSLGVTRRTLERQFKSAGGASPATIAKVGRFLHACHRIRNCPATEIGEIAHELGYSDHAHFSNRFKQHALITPSEFRRLHSTHMVDPAALASLVD